MNAVRPADPSHPSPQLQTGLCDLGYYPGDEDIDDFYFGEGTQSALMTMQARCAGCSCGRLCVSEGKPSAPAFEPGNGRCSCRCTAVRPLEPCPLASPALPPHLPQCCEGLDETGIADAATWAKLLGPGLAPKPSRDLTADMMVNVPGLNKLMGGGDSSAASTPAADASGSGAAGGKPAYAELFTAAFTETAAPTPEGGLQDVQQLRVSNQVATGGKLVSDTVEVEQRVVVAPGGDSAQVSGSIKADHKETYTGEGSGLQQGGRWVGAVWALG